MSQGRDAGEDVEQVRNVEIPDFDGSRNILEADGADSTQGEIPVGGGLDDDVNVVGEILLYAGLEVFSAVVGAGSQDDRAVMGAQGVEKVVPGGVECCPSSGANVTASGLCCAREERP